MTPKPLVSIALCIYNGEAFLEQQLQTLLNQTYTHLEFVIVDDGSTDDSLAMVNKYAADKRVKLFVNTRNLGYVKNFEKAISLCNGDFIALADQDDIWNLQKIEILVQQIGHSILVYHDSQFIDAQGKPMGKISDRINMYAGSNPAPFLFYNCISGHSCLFKKELVPRLGSFNPQFYHDWWIAFVAANCGSISYVNQPLVQYRQHQLSSTDILNRKEKVIKQSPKYSEVNILWLRNCERFAGSCQELIRQIMYLHENKSTRNSFKLLRLLLKHYRELYYIKKKSNASKLNYIRKMVFYNRRQYHTL